MKHQSRFSHRQENATQQQTGNEAREFASSDELLRHDAAHTVVPPAIEARLKKSAAEIVSPAPRPWWKAWLGR